MTGGKIVILIIGVIVLLVALGLIISGGALLVVNNYLADDEGYYSTKTIRIEKDSYAIVSEPIDVDMDEAWILDWGNLASFRVEGTNDDPSKNIFIGVAEGDDVKNYLANAEYDEVTDIDVTPNKLEYTHHTGDLEPAAPDTQTFWLESAYGAGEQVIEWELESGSWSVVVMNEDGSYGIDVDVVLGAKIPWLFSVALWLLILGVVVLIAGLVLIFLAVRGGGGDKNGASPNSRGAVGSGDSTMKPSADSSGVVGGGGSTAAIAASDYPTGLVIDYPDRNLNRLTTFFRLFAIIPIWIVFVLLGGAIIGWEDDPWSYNVYGIALFIVVPTLIMILFRQKYPKWWYDWNLAMTGFATRVYAYLALLSDEYPSTDEEQAVHIAMPYPDAKEDLNRWMPLVKWLLAIPHYIILFFLNVVAVVVTVIAWFAIMFTGRYPRDLFDFVVGTFRWNFRVTAYAFLLTTDRYPPFRFSV